MSQMSFEEAVRSRRSVRGFLDRPVPQDVMEKVFDIARWSPLAPICNLGRPL